MITYPIERDGLIYLPNENQPFTGVFLKGVSSPFKCNIYPYFDNVDLICKDIKGGFLSINICLCRYFYEDGILVRRVCFDFSKGGINRAMTDVTENRDDKERYFCFKNGKRNCKLIHIGNDETDWYKYTQKITEINLKDNILNGKYFVWHENGSKRFECSFENGKIKDGAYKEYYPTREKKNKFLYKNGMLESKQIWNLKGEKKTNAIGRNISDNLFDYSFFVILCIVILIIPITIFIL